VYPPLDVPSTCCFILRVISCVDLLREPRSVFTRYVYSTGSNLQLGK
jgi:hypothetical protein